MHICQILQTVRRGMMMGGRNEQAMIRRDKKLLDNDTEESEKFSFGDETLDTTDESIPPTMIIYLDNSDFGNCTPDNRTDIDDNIMSPLHKLDWYEDDTYSSHENDSDSS